MEARTFALRQGYWKYILPRPGAPATITLWQRKNIERGGISIPQLDKLDEDHGEQNNLAEKFPEKVEELHGIMMEIVEIAE